MSRAVGGASAVGCGVFGLGSLILGIGLTVWLGSTVMSSTTGSGGSGGSGSKTQVTAESQVSTLRSSVEGLAPPPVAGMEPSGASVVVPGKLAAQGSVTVKGDRLAEGPIDVTACLTKAGSPGEVAGCDAATTVSVTVDPNGRFALDYPIHRVITVDGTAYDCAARAAACSLFAHRPDNLLDTGLASPMVFTTGLPPVDAAPPPEG